MTRTQKQYQGHLIIAQERVTTLYYFVGFDIRKTRSGALAFAKRMLDVTPECKFSVKLSTYAESQEIRFSVTNGTASHQSSEKFLAEHLSEQEVSSDTPMCPRHQEPEVMYCQHCEKKICSVCYDNYHAPLSHNEPEELPLDPDYPWHKDCYELIYKMFWGLSTDYPQSTAYRRMFITIKELGPDLPAIIRAVNKEDDDIRAQLTRPAHEPLIWRAMLHTIKMFNKHVRRIHNKRSPIRYCENCPNPATIHDTIFTRKTGVVEICACTPECKDAIISDIQRRIYPGDDTPGYVLI